ncbi:MAG: DUF465 domain-containing protein [Gammaproteobacteria bacterium]|nr:DUF465 domain-containing protein [Gammaproteobacteria bacterium]
MYGEHHRLAEEFAEYKDRIRELKMNDAHFAKKYTEYAEVDDEVYRIEEEIETPSDVYTETLKKRRAKLKDELYSLLREA